jgi:hypothetical protein
MDAAQHELARRCGRDVSWTERLHRLPSDLGEAGVERQQPFLDAEPEAERPMESDVPCDVSAQHGTCSGHG